MDSVGLARVVLALAFAAVVGIVCANRAHAADATDTPLRIDVWADRDDDDANGVPDSEEQVPVPVLAMVDLVPLDKRLVGAVLEVVSGGEHARLVLAGGSVLPWGRAVPGPAWLQGVSPGRVELVSQTAPKFMRLSVGVSGIDLRDGHGEVVDMARSHASLERTPPARIEGPVTARYDDDDALRVVLAIPDDGPGLDGEREVAVESVSLRWVRRMRRDSPLAAEELPCACSPYVSVRCWVSAPLRLVIDDVDRDHPLVADRSIKAELGGAISYRSGRRKAQMIRVLGPRTSSVGPIQRLRATLLRSLVVRACHRGERRRSAERRRAPWPRFVRKWSRRRPPYEEGQCGLSFGDPRGFDVKVVDPPPSHLIALGDDLGIAASGGNIRLRAEGRAIVVATTPGETPERAASDVAHALEKAGLSPVVSRNARIGPGIGSSVDVSVRRRDGTLASVDTLPDTPLSTDGTLSVRIGSVDLTGQRVATLHRILDAMAGTLEERTLLKAFDDGDPSTIEVVVVPLAGGGRIGESFIGSDLSSVRNVVLLDRAGIRARKSSLTLAHELGHVLMDLPGHPDDFQVDTPSLRMDSDAADASPFGPRRITLDECARMVRQSGPHARVPLLVDWPVGPIP